MKLKPIGNIILKASNKLVVHTKNVRRILFRVVSLSYNVFIYHITGKLSLIKHQI